LTTHTLFDYGAERYRQYRPTYPAGFFRAFANRCTNHRQVWDCGCGNGQASVALAKQFERVIGTDASAAQIGQALPHPRVSYRVASASHSGLEPASVDAVLVAQAIHWFAGNSFNAEVQRVARPGAVMAWIGYGPLQIEHQPLQQLVANFYGTTLKSWWAPERRWVDRGFAGLPFPGEEWPFPSNHWLQRHWTLEDLLGYLSTWSAVTTAADQGQQLLHPLAQDLAASWPGQGNDRLLVRWPFIGRWGQISPAGRNLCRN